MEIINSLANFDRQLLLTLNQHHSPFWDNFFWLVTNTITWIPLYVAIFYTVVKRYDKKSWLPLLSIILVIVLCDQISTNVFKEGIERLRPSHEPDMEGMLHLLAGKKGGKFGFVSSHAANSFGLALFAILLFRNRLFSMLIVTWAALNSYSRIYAGLHYPGDVIGGMLLGLTIALSLFLIFEKRFKKLGVFTKDGLQKEMIWVNYTLVLSIIMLLISAKLFLKLQ
jgi:undecaprenyl-diphosphatase